MSWTKRNFINQAFSKIGMTSYAYDAEPSELQDAAVELDAMMLEWHENDIQFGWPVSSNPENTDIDVDTQTPQRARRAIYLNLALQLCDTYGKEPGMNLKTQAHKAFTSLHKHYVKVRPMKRQALPSGRGDYYSRIGNFNPLPQPEDNRISKPKPNIGFNDDY